jgi:hypothetical protein
MESNFRYLKLAVVVPLISGLSLMTGCTRQSTETPPQDLSVAAVTLGKPVFQFDPAQTISLNIAKADPISGETWSARVEKSPSDLRWRIASYSGDSQLSDRFANGGWIEHFLETLTTFRPDSVLSETDSGHYGFSPPRYSLEWRIQNPGTHQTSTYELRVGAPVDFEKSPDGEAFTMFPTHEEIYQAGGAALVMLRYLKSFSSLRLETLSTLGSTDVTEIEVKGPGKKTFHSKSNGGKWAGASTSALVDFITHLRIQSFIDHETTHEAFLPSVTIRLTDRYAHVTTLFFDEQDRAKNSDRGDMSFKLYPGSVSKLTH